VRPDDSPDQAFLSEVLEALATVGLSGRMHDYQVTRMTPAAKALLDPLVHGFGDPHHGEAVDSNRRAVPDRGDCLGDRDQPQIT